MQSCHFLIQYHGNNFTCRLYDRLDLRKVESCIDGSTGHRIAAISTFVPKSIDDIVDAVKTNNYLSAQDAQRIHLLYKPDGSPDITTFQPSKAAESPIYARIAEAKTRIDRGYYTWPQFRCEKADLKRRRELAIHIKNPYMRVLLHFGLLVSFWSFVLIQYMRVLASFALIPYSFANSR